MHDFVLQILPENRQSIKYKLNSMFGVLFSTDDLNVFVCLVRVSKVN